MVVPACDIRRVSSALSRNLYIAVNRDGGLYAIWEDGYRWDLVKLKLSDHFPLKYLKNVTRLEAKLHLLGVI